MFSKSKPIKDESKPQTNEENFDIPSGAHRSKVVDPVEAFQPSAVTLPVKYNFAATESRLRHFWERTKIFSYDPARSREETFVVDTPPPTVSGSLHIGHVFSYTQTDIQVRYQRMLGKNIMYPMGADDNGLPTERRVQNKFGIKCNPSLSYDPNWQPAEVGGKTAQHTEVARKNFVEACELVTREDEQAFAELWRHIGLSVDWDQ